MKEIDYHNPSDEFMLSIDVHTLLPQQEPFVMIGNLRHFEDKKVVSCTEIKEDNIFVSNGKMQAYGLIENIAQTCAARIGYINKYILKRGIQIGYIGAIKNLTIHSLPNINDIIQTEIDVEEELLGMILVSAIIKNGNDVLVSCNLKIAIKEE